MENKIIYIEINDWEMSFNSESLKNIFDDLNKQNLENVYFNYSMTCVDMAAVYLITTTKEDLVEHHMEELLQYEINEENKSMFTSNFYRKYNPMYWHDKNNNGLFFDSYEYSRKLYLLVDKNDREYMVDYEHLPFKNDVVLPIHIKDKSSLEKTYHYINNDPFYKVSYGSGWCQDTEEKLINGTVIEVPVFEDFVLLPKGFIENYLGKKITYNDEPVEYKTFNVENLKIWNE